LIAGAAKVAAAGQTAHAAVAAAAGCLFSKVRSIVAGNSDCQVLWL